MPKLLKLVLAVLLTGALFAGCGGDDDDDAGADVDTDVTVDPEALATFGNEECREATAAYATALNNAGAAFGSGSEDLDETVEQLEAFAEGAPDEIKADFEIVLRAYSAFVEAYADLDFDPSSGQPPDPETIAALQELSEDFQQSEFQEAAEHISAWFDENCNEDS